MDTIFIMTENEKFYFENWAKALEGKVCGICGGKVEPISTVDNSNNPTYWPGCMKCSRFHTQIDPIFYKIMVKIIPEEKDDYKKLSMSQLVARIIAEWEKFKDYKNTKTEKNNE